MPPPIGRGKHRHLEGVIGAREQYAQRMTSPPLPEPRPLARRARSVGLGIPLIAVGIVIDIYGVVNVPGAVTFSSANGGEAKVTGLGTWLALIAICAWITAIWRHRRPVIPMVAGGVLAAIGLSYILLLVGAVHFVRQRPDRLRLTATFVSIGVVLFVVREAFTPWGAALPWLFTTTQASLDDPGWGLGALVLAAISLGVAASIVAVARSRARAEQSDQRADAQLRRADVLTEQAARQAERERIARDMHDALAHRLSVVSLHAGALEAAAGQGDASEMARTVREQTHAALQDMRGLIGELRSPDETASPAPATMRAIGAMLTEMRTGGQALTSFVMIESAERAGALFDSAVYRIVQEALTNAIKHASGDAVDVFVHVSPADGARLRIVNPVSAAGSAGIPGGGNGILGIRERATALGGEAWIGAYEGSFIVDVSLPWQERG